jgi:YbbR domain-containing protein
MSDGRRSFTLFLKHIVRKIFFEDWLTKLVALAVTLALWLGVTGLSKPTTTRLTGIPLSLRYSSDTEVTNSPITEIDVIISGDNRKIAQINKNDLVASVDLTSLLPGDRVIQLTPENIQLQLPLGVRLDEITPGRMAVRLEAVEEKDLNVKIESTGKLPDGYEVYSQTAVPGRVRVRGPVSLTKTLTEISTEKVDLNDRKADFVGRQIALAPPNGKLTLLDAAVDVNFRIGERRVERLFVVPVSDGSNHRVSVVLYGPLTLLRDLKPTELQATISKNDAGADTAQVNLPAELQGVVEIRRTRIV